MALHFYREHDQWGELSNFYLLKPKLVYNGQFYSTSEHLYQCLKYLYPGAPVENEAYAAAIRGVSTPFKAKLLANRQRLTQYPWQRALVEIMNQYPSAQVRPDWEQYKETAMKICLEQKFGQNLHCRQVLIKTGSQLLVEVSPDLYWGSGKDGRGQNQLGKLLMQVRQQCI